MATTPLNKDYKPNTAAGNLSVELINLVTTGDRSGNSTARNGSRELAAAMYPFDVELYYMALELVNAKGQTVDFMSFPILPESVAANQVFNTSIEKTMAGTVVNVNTTFTPFDINLNGTFGRGFKILDYYGVGFNSQENADGEGNEKFKHKNSGKFQYMFDPTGRMRTGFGCYKMLEYIILKSKGQSIDGKPYRLIFYNFTLGNNYMVEAVNLQPAMNHQTNNMMWNYSLTLRAVAPAEAIQRMNTAQNNGTTWNARNKVLNNSGSAALKAATKNQKEKSKVQKIIERQIRARALNIFNNNQQAAIIAVTQLLERPANEYKDIFNGNRESIPREFGTNVFESVLNKL